MTGHADVISDIRVDVCEFPTHTPEADGTISWDSTTVLIVHVSAGDVVGMGYSYTHAAAAQIVGTLLRDVVIGAPVDAPRDVMMAMARAARNVGCSGVTSSAIAAVDIAVWDLHCKLRDVPLVTALGQEHDRIKVYESSGFTTWSDDRLERVWSQARDRGVRAFKMKVGRDIDRDCVRVGIARHVIGEDADLFLDANGAWDVRDALMNSRRLDAAGQISWMEEPVSSDDVIGLAEVRRLLSERIRVTAGEYLWAPWQLPALLDAQAVDVVQVDATRCLGVSGFMQCAVRCAEQRVPLSAHTAPAIHVQLCCASEAAINTEWFYDHARIEASLFSGVRGIDSDGTSSPNLDRSGHGLTVHRDVMNAHRIKHRSQRLLHTADRLELSHRV